MAKPSPWGGEPERLEPTLHDLKMAIRGVLLSVAMDGVTDNAILSAEATILAAWNRRTPSQSPDGYEVQWRPRGSDTWDGGSAGVYRTPEIASEVVQEFTNHETRVRPIAYLDGAPSQSREELEEALRGLGVDDGTGVPCFCQMAVGNPMVRSHSPKCRAARIALGEREP